MIDFNNTDLEQLKVKISQKETVLTQVEIFKKEIPSTNLVAAATLGNGLIQVFSRISKSSLKSIIMIIVKHYQYKDCPCFRSGF